MTAEIVKLEGEQLTPEELQELPFLKGVSARVLDLNRGAVVVTVSEPVPPPSWLEL